jgi:hypothetical protein
VSFKQNDNKIVSGFSRTQQNPRQLLEAETKLIYIMHLEAFLF